MPLNQSRRGSAPNVAPFLMAVAILAVGGFFYWLWQQAQMEAERQAEALAAMADEEDAPDIADAVTVELADLSRDMSRFAGLMVRVEGVVYGGSLGRQGFFADAPTPFLISAPSLVQDTENPIQSRGSMIAYGTIDEGGVAAFEGWLENGTIGDGDMVMADFAARFLNLVALESSDGTVVSVREEEDEGGDEDESGSGN